MSSGLPEFLILADGHRHFSEVLSLAFGTRRRGRPLLVSPAEMSGCGIRTAARS
jgi:hypothetical protein